MLRIIFFFTSLFLLFPHLGNADVSNCEQQEGYKLYSCRVKNVCEKYDGNLRVYNTEKEERSYLEGYNLYIAKKQYRENMNNIYKCAMLKSQNNAYKEILRINKTNAYSGIFEDRIKGQMKTLERKLTSLDCLKTEKKSFQLKKDVLDESTLEMCKYLYFLDYVEDTHIGNLHNLLKDKEISQQVEEVFEQDPQAGRLAYLELTQVEKYEFQREEYSVGLMLELEKEARQELAEEIRHTKRVYEVAYQTYANYESNVIIHLLLNFLETDFIQLRNSIYATISPINQVVYKIANAMSF